MYASPNSLEESKHGRVGDGGLAQRGKLLDDDMRVSDDKALSIELLGSGEVVRGSVDEIARFQVLDGQSNIEVRVGLDGASVR